MLSASVISSLYCILIVLYPHGLVFKIWFSSRAECELQTSQQILSGVSDINDTVANVNNISQKKSKQAEYLSPLLVDNS